MMISYGCASRPGILKPHEERGLRVLNVNLRKLGRKQQKTQNYFTSSDPHHDMSGEGCQVRAVI